METYKSQDVVADIGHSAYPYSISMQKLVLMVGILAY